MELALHTAGIVWRPKREHSAKGVFTQRNTLRLPESATRQTSFLGPVLTLQVAAWLRGVGGGTERSESVPPSTLNMMAWPLRTGSTQPGYPADPAHVPVRNGRPTSVLAR
jgi:hypothetical protein